MEKPLTQESATNLADPGGSVTIYLRPAEFVSLATSRQKLLRADRPGSGMRGLVDPKTGNVYYVEATRLQLQ